MNGEFLIRVARANWHVLLVMVGILAFAAYHATSGESVPVQASAAAIRSFPPSKPAPEKSNENVVTQQLTLNRESALAAIRENEEALLTSRDTTESAAYLNGIANLYFQRLQDYESAANYYERVLSECVGAPGAYQTYVQLALCYERLNQPEKRVAVLRRMLGEFPSDSQEYAYAHIELYGKLPDDIPVANEAPADAESLELAKAQ